jgi:hypothetical protein
VRIFSFGIHYYCPEEHLSTATHEKMHLGCTAGIGCCATLRPTRLSDALLEPATLY